MIFSFLDDPEKAVLSTKLFLLVEEELCLFVGLVVFAVFAVLTVLIVELELFLLSCGELGSPFLR